LSANRQASCGVSKHHNQPSVLVIGNYIITEIQYETYSQYGQQIVATLSRTLTEKQWFIDKLNKSIAIAQQNVKEIKK
jgi:hypothetical protein